ncbi:hypothetical protein ANTPLA_LOCUS5783 [Anthophora plagiata]
MGMQVVCRDARAFDRYAACRFAKRANGTEVTRTWPNLVKPVVSRSSPDATSQYRVSPPAELVSDLCQSRWSYQWGKQKLVCKRTCLTATVVHHVLDRGCGSR